MDTELLREIALHLKNINQGVGIIALCMLAIVVKIIFGYLDVRTRDNR